MNKKTAIINASGNQLGQHFIENEKLLKRLAEHGDLEETDTVLEIGAGTGNLTKVLSESKAGKIIATEIDPALSEMLKEKKYKKTTIKTENGLKTAKNENYNKIISNIPYHISEPLFRTILKKTPELCVFTTGKKFWELLIKNEGAVASGINSTYTLEIIENINKSSFSPEPKTNSIAFRMKLRKDRTEKDKLIAEIVKQDDKTLKNAVAWALKRVMNKTGKDAEAESKIIIPEHLAQKRVIHLSKAQFLEVKKIVEKISSNDAN